MECSYYQQIVNVQTSIICWNNVHSSWPSTRWYRPRCVFSKRPSTHNIHVHFLFYVSVSLSERVTCSYMRADLNLQWRIAIAIFELPSVHTGEKTSPSLRFSIPERGQEAWFVFWHAEWYFILDRIAIRKCTVYWRKWLEGHVAPPPKSQFSGQGIHTVISLHYLRMRH